MKVTDSLTAATQAADHVPGAVQGAVDAVTGTDHRARTWTRDPALPGRLSDAQARWHDGRAARNQFERDACLTFEAEVTGGLNRLSRQAEQATELEARLARQAETEAGQ